MVDKISINEVREVLEAIFASIEHDLGDSIPLSDDYYWEVSERSLYDMNSPPSDFTIGSLYADLEFLRRGVREKREAVQPLLIHIAPLLRYIATRTLADE